MRLKTMIEAASEREKCVSNDQAAAWDHRETLHRDEMYEVLCDKGALQKKDL